MMSLFEEITTIDFETHKIISALPPEPVGISIKRGSEPSKYYAWGHVNGQNNCSWEDVEPILYHSFKGPCLFHNAQFDIAVAKQHFGIDFPAELHDTLLLLFLRDPHSKNLQLKPCSEQLLNWAPEERDVVNDWILASGIMPKGVPKKEAGGYIAHAPVELVAPYACGDTDRTYALFCKLYNDYKGKAYDRERKLVPILVKNTLRGIKLDTARLEQDYDGFIMTHHKVTDRIHNLLGGTFNIDSGDELAAAIIRADVPASWVLTPTGKRSTAKKNLLKAVQHPELLDLLAYRGTLSTYLETFFSAWIEKRSGDRLHFAWNQVRNDENGGVMGTRTGRLSSKPSMLNVPKAPPVFGEYLGLPALPHMRSYLLPEDIWWLKRDYASQELRVLAHYEDGLLLDAYRANPYLDMHQLASDRVSAVLMRLLSRRDAKTLAFSILYGSGLDLLAEQLGVDYNTAKESKAAYLQELPGIKAVQASIKYNWDRGQPITTWGGRDYYKEPSRDIKDKRTGGMRYADFGYKGLNYLIQGSSADVTKQAMINYDEAKVDGEFLLSVHDEINITGPLSELKVLDEAMRDIKIDCPMVSDGSYGPNYGTLRKEA